MSRLIIFMLLLALNPMVFCQNQGESEVKSFSIKRPPLNENSAEDPGNIAVPDITPPVIRIISPQMDTSLLAQISEPNVYLIGRLTDDSGIKSLVINGSLVSTDENGFFQLYSDLEEGLNVFEIIAADAVSNSKTQFLQLVYDSDEKALATKDEPGFMGEYYALIIGVDEYSDPDLVDLDHPITDATLLYSTLIGNYSFAPENVALMKNPGRADIIRKLDEYRYTITESDNLLIFFAGHGYWDSERETGFWLPADADKLSSVNWIRNSTIQDYVDDINTNHTLLITDACFAGAIFKSRGAFQDASIGVNKLYSLTSRKAMTSGTLEEVPDRSVFLEYLMKRLQENDKKYISAGELFNSFRDAVLNNSPSIPQYGVIQGTGDEGGDFIFIKR